MNQHSSGKEEPNTHALVLGFALLLAFIFFVCKLILMTIEGLLDHLVVSIQHLPETENIRLIETTRVFGAKPPVAMVLSEEYLVKTNEQYLLRVTRKRLFFDDIDTEWYVDVEEGRQLKIGDEISCFSVNCELLPDYRKILKVTGCEEI